MQQSHNNVSIHSMELGPMENFIYLIHAHAASGWAHLPAERGLARPVRKPPAIPARRRQEADCEIVWCTPEEHHDLAVDQDPGFQDAERAGARGR